MELQPKNTVFIHGIVLIWPWNIVVFNQVSQRGEASGSLLFVEIIPHGPTFPAVMIIRHW